MTWDVACTCRIVYNESGTIYDTHITRDSVMTHGKNREKSWILQSLDCIAQSSPDSVLIREYGAAETSVSRGEFWVASRKLAHLLQTLGVTKGSVLLIDIDMRQHWQAYAAWCACQWIGAAAFFWPPDMRFRFAQAETIYADQRNHQPTIVFAATRDRIRRWQENDKKSAFPARKFLCLESSDDSMTDVIPFDQVAEIPLPEENFGEEREGEEDEEIGEAALVYTQGSHQDARRIALSFEQLHTQAEEIQQRFSLTPDHILAFDLPSIQTVSLVLFATCLHVGAIFVCRSDDVPMLHVLHQSNATHAFCLPTTLQQIVSDLQAPASRQARRWRAFCLRLGKYRQRNPQTSLRSLIHSLCLQPLKNKLFPALQSVVSYGNHFHVKSAEILHYLGILVSNAYTVAEFGIVHLHGFMGQGSFLHGLKPSIHAGILTISDTAPTPRTVCTDDLIFEDDSTGLCTHRRHMIQLGSGKTIDVAPAREYIRQNPLIEDIFLFGESRPFLTALIYLHPQNLCAWATQRKIPGKFEEITQNPEVYQHILHIIEKSNLRRPAAETIQKIALLPCAIADDPRILTPCRLTRIPDIARRYAALIDSFYRDSF